MGSIPGRILVVGMVEVKLHQVTDEVDTSTQYEFKSSKDSFCFMNPMKAIFCDRRDQDIIDTFYRNTHQALFSPIKYYRFMVAIQDFETAAYARGLAFENRLTKKRCQAFVGSYAEKVDLVSRQIIARRNTDSRVALLALALGWYNPDNGLVDELQKEQEELDKLAQCKPKKQLRSVEYVPEVAAQNVSNPKALEKQAEKDASEYLAKLQNTRKCKEWLLRNERLNSESIRIDPAIVKMCGSKELTVRLKRVQSAGKTVPTACAESPENAVAINGEELPMEKIIGDNESAKRSIMSRETGAGGSESDDLDLFDPETARILMSPDPEVLDLH